MMKFLKAEAKGSPTVLGQLLPPVLRVDPRLGPPDFGGQPL
jgi:hypothetical protein